MHLVSGRVFSHSSADLFVVYLCGFTGGHCFVVFGHINLVTSKNNDGVCDMRHNSRLVNQCQNALTLMKSWNYSLSFWWEIHDNRLIQLLSVSPAREYFWRRTSIRFPSRFFPHSRVASDYAVRHLSCGMRTKKTSIAKLTVASRNIIFLHWSSPFRSFTTSQRTLLSLAVGKV